MLLFHIVLIILLYILYGMADSIIYDLQHIQNTAARILAKCCNSFIYS